MPALSLSDSIKFNTIMSYCVASRFVTTPYVVFLGVCLEKDSKLYPDRRDIFYYLFYSLYVIACIPRLIVIYGGVRAIYKTSSERVEC